MRIPKPPPIMVSNVANYDLLYTVLPGKKLKFKAAVLNNYQIILNTKKREALRITIDCLG